MIWEEISFEEFQDSGHLSGYRNRTILTLLNVLAGLMPAIRHILVKRCHLKNSIMAAILDIIMEGFQQF